MQLSSILSVIILAVLCNRFSLGCTITTAIGTHAPKSFCAGDLIFEDNFDSLNLGKWKHEITMWGGGNNEFQWYVNDRKNTFVKDGKLHLKATNTADLFGEEFIYSGRVVIPDYECTNSANRGCDRTGEGHDGKEIVNPVRSAKVSTIDSLSFKYGTLEIRAKVPAGDWLFPALWMMPKNSVYGNWPRSGEVDLMESTGNLRMFQGQTLIGTNLVFHTLMFGIDQIQNGFEETIKYTYHGNGGWHQDFHNYKMVWTNVGVQMYVDDVLVNSVFPGEGGLYEYGKIEGINPWLGREKMAPFDQEFYINMNLAVGGDIFPNNVTNAAYPKPFSNVPATMQREFWQAKDLWEPTWKVETDDSHFQIDYVRIWAV